MAKQNMVKIFIDGEAGTTGLGIRERLAGLSKIELLTIASEQRKDAVAKVDLYREADLVVLCLPDDAAKAAVDLADSLADEAPRLIDASSAHRVEPDWVYGFPELTLMQPEAIRTAKRVANPGCYPSGALALLRPLIESRLLPRDYPIAIHAVSGYSGGGKGMIEAYEAGIAPAFELYGLSLEHKHVPEIHAFSGLARRPIFVPSVGNFRQGMLVSIALHLDLMAAGTTVAHLEEVLRGHYAASPLVQVIATSAEGGRIEPQAVNDSDRLELRVFGNLARHQALLVARLDNLGKGASGAAVQNIRLMLDMPA
jgi:N-acetyl-gamma-glutamyl-phosphate reductase